MSGNAMNCHWSSENLLAGYREELSEPESRSLTLHLDACDNCRNDRQEMVLLQEAIASIPEFEPATGSFDAIQNSIRASIRKENAMAGPTGRGRLLFFGGVLAAAAAAVFAFVLFLLPPSPPAPLTSLAGLLTVDGASVAKGTEFTPAKGTRLVTGSLALVAFAAPRAGEFTLGKGAKVTCISEGRFRLEAGRLLAEIRPGAGGVTIETPLGTIEVTGTTFDLDLTTGNLVLSVLSGAVTLRTGDKPVRVDSGTAVTVAPGGQPGPPQPVDPYQVRRWCSTPAARLEASPTRLRLVLANETVRPLVIKPYDPSVGVYALRIERVGVERVGTEGAEDVKLQEAMLSGSAPVGPPDSARTLRPGEAYELAIDPAKLGLSPGTYRIRAVYNPYTKDLPAGAWRGVLISPPTDLSVR